MFKLGKKSASDDANHNGVSQHVQYTSGQATTTASATATSSDDLIASYWNKYSLEPEMTARFFLSGLLFQWIQPLFTRAAKLHREGNEYLQQQDLVPLPAMDHSKRIEDCFEKAYQSYVPPEKKKSRPPKKTTPSRENEEELTASKKQRLQNDKQELEQAKLLHGLYAVISQRLITAGVVKFFNTCFQFTFPILLNLILTFFQKVQAGIIDVKDPNTSFLQKYQGYWLSALLCFFVACKAVTESAYFHKVNRCSWQVRTSISGAVYRKSIRLASSAQQQTTLGEMVNLMQVDATKLESFIPQIHVLWDGILQTAGYMTILGTLLGWPCLMGLIVMMFAGPVMGIIMSRLFGINREMVKYTDQRVKTVNEALQGIRSVKMYTWEESFANQIGISRNQELQALKRMAYLKGFSRAYMTALPTVAAVATFIVYTYATNGPITAATLFSSIVAFDQLRFPLMFYPMAIAQYAQAVVSLHRVAAFLNYKEVTDEGYERIVNAPTTMDTADTKNGGNGKSATTNSVTGGKIVVENATVYWSDPNVPMTRAEMEDKSLDKSEHTKSEHSNAKDTASASATQTGEDVEEALIYPKPVVSNVSLTIHPGELCAVIGRVGSGKSSLCSAILNETVLGEGSKIMLQGRVAYAAQSAWILNKSVRDNILFGLPYDEKRYQKVIQVCQLTHDLEMLEDGDATEIGEKGINLSGGQKQRVSVARAAYSDADVIIFDDPLSALDPEVALKLFEECICDFLSTKTRLLVTNQLQCLPKCDSVIALARGQVIEQGTYTDIMKMKDGAVQKLLKELEESSQKKETVSEETDETLMIKPSSGKALIVVNDKKEPSDRHVVPKTADTEKEETSESEPTDAKKLMTKEERESGAVKLQVYLKYMRAGGGGLQFFFVFAAYILSSGVNLAKDVWISLWTGDATYENFGRGFYIGGYAGFGILVGVFTFVRAFLFAIFGVKASNALHQGLIASIFRAPMSFFDTTPTGRILSRFSKDMYTIDLELADFFDWVIFMSISVVVTLATILFATPWFGVALLPLGYVYIKILNYFRDVSRETKRLESLSRSPVYAHFSETLGGLSTIRAYGETSSFVSEFETKLDASTRAGYCNKTADRWLSCRLELIGASIAGLAAIFATQVIISEGPTAGSPSKFASLAGLSLTYAIQITGMLQFVVRSFAQVEAAMNSCERVLYYTEHIAQEAPMLSDELEKEAMSISSSSTDLTESGNSAIKAVVANGGAVVRPSAEWPSKGAIQMNNLIMRYRPETPLVLKGLNVTIQGGERIGVVGRTGSGKSSLLLCLMRIVEPELDSSILKNHSNYEAPLVIDGVDVLRVGLLELRTKVGIIPQSPVLFSGTIRSNIDPFDDYTDDQIWAALSKCGMQQAVLQMSDELQSPVAEYGENLSQGQRQLLCLGRALLKQCRILLLDEATSSVDFETDREIQRTIREEFAGSTVLTIAHRINTILDSDKILVMKDGVAAEFAPPNELLKDENSLFSDIVRHSQAENE